MTIGGEETGWLESWANQHLAVTVTFIEGVSAAELLERLSGAPDTERREFSLDELDSFGTEWARCGDTNGWGFIVEHFTTHGTDPAFLRRVCVGARSVTLSYTQTINGFLYAVGGEVIVGFELEHPEARHGARPSEIDDQFATAGWDPAVPASGLDAGRLVELLTGVKIDRRMLEARLPAVPIWEPQSEAGGPTVRAPSPPRGVPLEQRFDSSGEP